MTNRAKLCLLFSSFLLVACQSTQVDVPAIDPSNQTVYADDIFEHYDKIDIETEQEIFAIDDEMRAMVREHVKPERNFKKRARTLLEQIFKNDNFGIAYESNANVIATDAYHKNIANCLSLTIMAYALAEEANLNAYFQDVQIPEYWVRHGEYNMLTGHVNLRLQGQNRPNESIILGGNDIEVDFEPFVLKKSFPKKIIKKNTVLAMFYNNKGAQAMVDSDYVIAYAYLKAATRVDPRFSAAWGNLGLLYRFNNKPGYAEKSYRRAIDLSKRNLTAMTNLSVLLKREGRTAEAVKIDHSLLKKRDENPYYHALLADEAFYQGDATSAVKHYKKALKLDNKGHEFYFGLAKAYYQLDKFDLAKRAMKRAIKINRAPAIEHEYLTKLDFLKAAAKSH